MKNNPRKIIHCDCDCFFAAVEIRDDPSLKGRPLAVGGNADRRGVISTCNYEARRFGVHSAMASATALRLCPDLLIIPPDIARYRTVSEQIRQIYYDYTELVEPLSLDEAYLDVSDCSHHRGSATLIAREIRERVKAEIGITVSAGVAPNKFLAKIGSDWNKPDGQWVITPDEVDAFVSRLPVSKLFGVGKVTGKKLQQMGVVNCSDLRAFSSIELVERFGRFGTRLYELCRGIDERDVKVDHRRKSLSIEHTYSEDLANLDACLKALPDLLVRMKDRLARVDDSYLVTKLFVKMKFSDFSITTIECGARSVRVSVFLDLCKQAFLRGNMPVRLMGVGVRFVDLLDQRNPLQLELFES